MGNSDITRSWAETPAVGNSPVRPLRGVAYTALVQDAQLIRGRKTRIKNNQVNDNKTKETTKEERDTVAKEKDTLSLSCSLLLFCLLTVLLVSICRAWMKRPSACVQPLHVPWLIVQHQWRLCSTRIGEYFQIFAWRGFRL